MTDSRLKGEWLGKIRFDQLSDTAWRVFTGALMWSNEQGTDGFIPDRYLKALHPDGEKPDAFAELERAGLLIAGNGGRTMPGWSAQLGQNTAEQVAAYRENARERQRRSRAGKALKSETGTSDSVRDVTRDNASDVGTGIGIGVSQQKMERDSTVRPDPFCPEHMPIGPGKEPCIGCMNANRAVIHWDSINPPQWKLPTPQPPRGEPDSMCETHPGYPNTAIAPCEACKREAVTDAA